MCYDIKSSKEAQLKRAKRSGDEDAVKEIEQTILPLTDLPLFHASGFQHPKLLIYTEESPYMPIVAQWGLVPHWVKDRAQQQKFWNNTLNARGETIFEKPAFRDAAKEHRCLVFVDGFYEHHHYKGKTYPYFISFKSGEPMVFAGLWNTWTDRDNGEHLTTFSIVTTTGNPLLARIHNNPKLEGPRMPFIIPEGMEDEWLRAADTPPDQKVLTDMIRSYPADSLQAHTVRRLRGKEYAGNIPEISEPFHYPELEAVT